MNVSIRTIWHLATKTRLLSCWDFKRGINKINHTCLKLGKKPKKGFVEIAS